MKDNKKPKCSSIRRSADKVSKKPTKRSTKKKAKWKVVGNAVCLSPGDYTIEDLEAMLKAIQGTSRDCTPHKRKAVK